MIFAGAACTRENALDSQAVYNSAWLKLKHGDLGGARADVDSIHFEKLAPDSEWSARFRVLKGEILGRQGMDNESLSLLELPLPERLATSDIAVWRKMAQAMACSHLGRYEESGRSLSEAESLATQYQPDLLGEVLLRKGTLAYSRDDWLTARSEYVKALKVARGIHDSYLEAACLSNLGLAATRLEHYDESVDWGQQALQLSRTTGARGATAVILGNMGWSYLDMGDSERALGLFQEAEEASREAGSVSAQVEWKTNIGNVYFQMRDFISAEEAYQAALGIAKNIDDEAEIAECFGNLALVSLDRNRPDAAQKYNYQFAEFVRAHPNHEFELYSRVISGRIEETKQNYAQARELFESVDRDPGLKTSLRWETESRLAQVYALEGKREEADRQFRRSLATIVKSRRSVQAEDLRMSFLSNAILFYNNYIEFLISQGRTQDALQVAEVSRAQTLTEGLGRDAMISFPLPNFRPSLIAQRCDATLLFYWLGEEHSYLWAVTRSGVSLFTLPRASEIEALIKTYREALLGPRDVLEASNAAGIKLYEVLVGPAEKLISRGSRVLILPDGGLYVLNFETLLVPSPRLHYWIEDAIVANANSLVLLAASGNEQHAKSKKLLLIGDPLSPSADFPDLPQAAAEMHDVEQYFPAPKRTVLSRQQATAAAYLASEPAQYSFIHFVAHGTASRTSPLDSAVVLTREGDSYKLYARDIVTQPLSADLVTISACHGAGDRTYSGEGLVGLAWAFLRAGAHGVIAALWEVNDNSTPQLMDDLYREMAKGSAADAALRHAKLRLLHSGTVYQKPFYWAPFEIYHGH